jgi:hypothetical protein
VTVVTINTPLSNHRHNRHSDSLAPQVARALMIRSVKSAFALLLARVTEPLTEISKAQYTHNGGEIYAVM